MAATATSAKDLSGRFSLGFHDSFAPIGIRYWQSELLAIDLGVGFVSNEVPSPSETDSTRTANTANLWIEAGVPMKVYDRDRTHFYVRPGILLAVLDDRDFGTGVVDDTWLSVDLKADLGAELFFGEHFSIEATHGVLLNITSPPSEIGGDSLINFKTFGRGLTEVGFRFYF